MAKVTVGYQAFSNISYNGTITFEVDDEEWAEMSREKRNQMIADEFEEFLREDVGTGNVAVDGEPYEQ